MFTVAHELGHYILQPLAEKEEYRLDEYRYDDKNAGKETEANYFAASLLIPE
ncbi:MAG: ImmA/IrrE family metallo-endopeptidase [Alphaproteobacteria bacterium]|nr:ImmA/IrrE family metallo-endopeptidase [Alphaproteobacteria bacterium]